MLHAVLKTVHLLSIVLWVGGMFFAHFCLRPALGALDPPVRLRLVHGVFTRFFGVVLIAAPAALVSGAWMMAEAASVGGAHLPASWSVMAALGFVMVAIFGYIRYALYRRLDRAVTTQDWPVAGAALAAIRPLVLINLGLGLAIIGMLRLSGS